MPLPEPPNPITDVTAEVGPPVALHVDPPLKRGSVLGRYVVLDVLGAGGMGEVYAAIDPELDRRVALKLVRSHAAGTDAQTRLIREAQAMAKLSHPNVVAIYDVGVVEGRVFLAMELVNGTTATQWVTAKQRSWQEIIAVYLEAGRGLAAAHHAGLVHRDFKPDNVLIGLAGDVHVSDLGLARATVSEAPAEAFSAAKNSLLSTHLTHAATVLGTPGYMAPEQFDGSPANEKTDQFSFCVSLYRSLYGQPAFRHDDIVSLVKAVKAGELEAPPAGARVPAWVHRVLVRGLSTAPASRFDSLDSLLEALSKDPTQRRRRWLAGSGVAMALIALGVGAVTAFQRHTQRCTAAESKLAGLWDEPRKRAITEAFEKSGIPYANDVWRTVRGSLDVYARQWVAQHTEACEATWVTGVQTDAVLTLRMRCLNDRLDELRSLTDLLINADANTVKAAPKAMSSLTVLSQCSDIAALERRMPLPKNADQRRRIELVQHRLAEATSLIGVGRYQDALAAMEKVAADANELGYAPLQAAATRWLIQLNGRLGHYSVIRDLVFETVRLSELAGDDQIRFFGTVGLASLGIETGEPLEQLLTYCRLAENMLSRIKDNAYSAAKLEVIRGNVYLVRGNAEMAAESYRRGLEIAERSIPDSIELISDLNDNVALADLALHHTYRARDEGLKSVALLIQRVGPHHPDVAFSQANLANMYLSLHAPEQALAMADQAIATRLEVLGHEHTLFAEVMGSKGLALAQLGRYDEAERALRESLDIADRVAPEGTVVFETSSLFGEFYLLTHRPEEALKAFTRASALATKLESTLGPVQQLGQGLALLDLRRYAEAEARISAAMQGLLTLGSNDDLSRAHLALAELHWQRGDAKTARSLAEEALSDLATVEGDTNGRTARVRGWLSEHPAR